MHTETGARTDARRTRRVEFLGFHFDALGLADAADRLRDVRVSDPFSYVVTPNVDHVVRINREEPAEAQSLKAVYDDAALCLCDSRIIAALAKVRGIDLPISPGSDLTAELFAGVLQPGDAINLIGGTEDLERQLRDRYPALVIRQHIPPMGLRHNRKALLEAAQFAADNPARFSFLAVGSPQQELLAAEIAKLEGARGVGLCIGASIEMLLGLQPRAPKVLRKVGLEWAHRLALQPQRMWRRYLVEGPRIFLLAAAWRPKAGK
jgi:N-acetylglucosaminyldiphosphoundecaprenol N-acetyl-beta-D-mannosaminyltransferase